MNSFENQSNKLDWFKGPFTKSRIAELRKKLAAARGMLFEVISIDTDEQLVEDVKKVLTETADL